MSILKSVFFGSEGNYNVWGLDISFKDFPPGDKPSRLISISDRVFGIASQVYLNTLVHEIGHAIAFRLSINRPSKINIYRDHTGFHSPSVRCPSEKIDSIVRAAGPLTQTAFAGVVLTSSIALRSSFPLLSMWCGCSAYYSIVEGFFNCIASAYHRDDGDFGILTKRSFTHLAAASALQIGLIALAHFGAYKAF